MLDLITFSGPVSGKVVGFRGTERMSRLYQFEIFVQTVGEFDLKNAAGQSATMVIDRATEGFVPFCFAGIIANVQVVHAFGPQVLVHVTLVPTLWKASLSRHSRMFTKMRVPDIITQILGENGVSQYELRLSGSYDTEEHVCQYRESDFDFISRWMEKEGIFYWFEHNPGGETLVLCDSPQYDVDPAGGVVLYVPQLVKDAALIPGFRAFGGGQRTLPTQVRVTDYDYAKPNLQLAGSAQVQQNGSGQVVLFGERFFDPGKGQDYAKMRAEEYLARESVGQGRGNRTHLRPGYVFTVEGHPFGSFNAPWLTIEARHSANQAGGHSAFRELMGIFHDEVYQVEVECIPAQTQYRAESTTPWPRIYGYELAVVDAPGGGPYAQIDKDGRYNLKFKFDESSLQGGQASTWVRMMQPHGGTVEGFHFPLRKDTEVMVVFLDGDPDRPVIFGVVPNAVKPSAVTSSNNTKNVIQTGSRNRLELEDKSGSEWVKLSTPGKQTHLFMGETGEGGSYNFELDTQGTGHIHTGQDLKVDVDGEYHLTVTKDGYEDYDKKLTRTVHDDELRTNQGKLTQYVFKDCLLGITQNYDREIHQQLTEYIGGYHKVTHGSAFELTRTGATKETLQSNVTRDITGNLTDHISSSVDFKAQSVKWDVSTTLNQHVGSNVQWNFGANVDWTITGNVKIDCKQWNVDAHEQTWKFSSPSFEHYQANKMELYVGTKNEFYMGEKGVFVGGVKIDVADALSLAFVAGMSVTLNEALTLDYAPLKLSVSAMSIKLRDAEFEAAAAAKIKAGGFEGALKAFIALL